MSQKLVKCLLMDERIRPNLTFSDATKIRLSPEDRRLQLRAQRINHFNGKTEYPIDTDLTVKIAPVNPLALRAWEGFDIYPPLSSQPENTTIQFRLTDGTNERYWDGGAWVVAGATDWNTQLEIVENIATFAETAQSKQLGIVVNLATSDKYVTPTIEYIDLLMDCNIDYLRSLVADALVPSIRSSITPRIEYAMKADGGNKHRLQRLETAFNIVSVDAVYDHENDQSHYTNLFSSYDAASKVITLATGVQYGQVLWIEFTVEPEVYVNYGSQDYLEVEKIPAVVIDSFTVSGNEVMASACVGNISTNDITFRRAPFRLAIDFEVLLLAEKTRTLLAMMDKALEHAANNQVLSWPACDDKVCLRILDEGIFRPRPELTDRHQSRYSLRMEDVFLWTRPAETKPMIQQLNLTISSPELQGYPKYNDRATDTATGEPEP
jgi:hypothetical protein